MKNTSKMLIVLGTGLAIGGVIGVLYAPNKGSETRRKFSEQGKKLTSKVKNKLKEERKEMEKQYNKVNDKVAELV